MFRCQNKRCDELTTPRQPVNRVVTKRRKKTYQNKKRRGRKWITFETEGWEIEEQIETCPKCFRQLTGQEPRIHSPEQGSILVERHEYRKRHFKNKKWKNPRKNKENNKFETSSPTEPEYEVKKVEVEVVNPIKIIK